MKTIQGAEEEDKNLQRLRRRERGGGEVGCKEKLMNTDWLGGGGSCLHRKPVCWDKWNIDEATFVRFLKRESGGRKKRFAQTVLT